MMWTKDDLRKHPGAYLLKYIRSSFQARTNQGTMEFLVLRAPDKVHAMPVPLYVEFTQTQCTHAMVDLLQTSNLVTLVVEPHATPSGAKTHTFRYLPADDSDITAKAWGWPTVTAADYHTLGAVEGSYQLEFIGVERLPGAVQGFPRYGYLFRCIGAPSVVHIDNVLGIERPHKSLFEYLLPGFRGNHFKAMNLVMEKQMVLSGMRLRAFVVCYQNLQQEKRFHCKFTGLNTQPETGNPFEEFFEAVDQDLDQSVNRRAETMRDLEKVQFGQFYTIGVRLADYNSGGLKERTWTYKVWKDLPIALNDIVVVPSGTLDAPQAGVCVEVHSVPQLQEGIAYKWVIQKVDCGRFFAQQKADEKIIEELEMLEQKKQIDDALSGFKEKIGTDKYDDLAQGSVVTTGYQLTEDATGQEG